MGLSSRACWLGAGGAGGVGQEVFLIGVGSQYAGDSAWSGFGAQVVYGLACAEQDPLAQSRVLKIQVHRILVLLGEDGSRLELHRTGALAKKACVTIPPEPKLPGALDGFNRACVATPVLPLRGRNVFHLRGAHLRPWCHRGDVMDHEGDSRAHHDGHGRGGVHQT